MATKEEAMRELARRELARRQAVGEVSASPDEQTWLQSAGNTALDVGGAALAGLGRGAAGLAGLPGTLSDLANNGLSWATGLPPLPQSVGSADAMQGYLSDATGGASEFKGNTTAGRYAGAGAEFVPGAALGGLNPANLLRFGVLPGVASEAAGSMFKDTAAEPYARVGAALVAPAIPALAARAISPFAGAISPERQQAIAALSSEGVPLTAGQQTGSKGLQYLESELGGRTAANMVENQGAAFTNAAMQRAGGSGLATPENLATNADRLGDAYQAISARNTLQADKPLADGIVGTLKEYNRVLPSEQQQILGNITADVIDRIQQGKGTMTGADYQTIRSGLTKRAHNARNSNPELAEAFRGIRNSLDDAMTRSVSPQDAAEWAMLRKQYGNSKVLEKAASASSASLGNITPAQLASSARTGRQGHFARGTGDFDELARAGQAVMSPLPNSGTAGRMRAQNLGAGVLAGGGALAGGLPGMIAGLVAPQLAGRALMSSPVQSYLVNQAAPAMSTIDPKMLNVIMGLLSNEQGGAK